MPLPLLLPRITIEGHADSVSLVKNLNLTVNVPHRPKYRGEFMGRLDFAKMGAIGFDLKDYQDEYYGFDWSFVFKTVNSSTQPIIIRDIEAVLSGKTADYATSTGWLTQITAFANDSATVSGSNNWQAVEMPPIIIQPDTASTLQITLQLHCMVKRKVGKDYRRVFRKSDIRQPETCRLLYPKARLIIKTSAGPIKLSFHPIIYVGDTLKIPPVN